MALLLTMSALALAVITPAMHYHQFGEPSRMARDAGFSALFIGGLFYVIFCTVKTFRREIDSGTLQMALSHPVSRAHFFLAKVCGVYLAFLVFAFTLVCATLTIVNGAEIGGKLLQSHGEVRPIWGPSFACAVMTLIVPPVLAAVLNRFAHFRWTLTATVLSALIAGAGVFYRFDGALVVRILPVAFLLLLPALLFTAIAAAFAVRWRENTALAATGVLFVAALPLLGNYYLSDVLARGGALSLVHVGVAVVATAPLVAAFCLLGMTLLEGRDVGSEGI